MKQHPKPQTNHTEILSRIFESFKNGMQSPISKKPKEYLQSRGLNYELLELGYNSWQFHHRGKLNKQDLQACINAGLLIIYKGKTPNGSSNYTPFAKDCVIFPLRNKQNQIVSIYGRRTTDETKNKHYYLKDRTGLYPNYPGINTSKLIITEAIIDAATLLQIEEITAEHEVLSSYGTNGLTSEHLQAIKELTQLSEIIFFFDGDQAGN